MYSTYGQRPLVTWQAHERSGTRGGYQFGFRRDTHKTSASKTYIKQNRQVIAKVTGFSAHEAIGNRVQTYVVSEEHYPSELLQFVQDARRGRETAMFCATLLTKSGKRIELQMQGKWPALMSWYGQPCRPVGGSS